MADVEVTCRSLHTGTTLSVGMSLLFGLPLLGLGALLFGAGSRLIPSSELSRPPAVVMAPGVLLLALGVYLLTRGPIGAAGRRRRQRLLARHPDEPWRADHPWSPEGAHASSYRDVARSAVAAACCALFMVPFNWWAFFSGDSHWFLVILVSLFDLLLVVAPVSYTVYRAGHALKYGGAFVRFDRFPFFLGETLSVHVGSDRPVGAYSRLAVTLRCVEVRQVTRSDADGESLKIGCYQRHAVTRELPAGVLNPGTEIEVTFPLPTGDYASQLGKQWPRYWELLVNATTSGIDFKADFLVPIYKKVKA